LSAQEKKGNFVCSEEKQEKEKEVMNGQNCRMTDATIELATFYMEKS